MTQQFTTKELVQDIKDECLKLYGKTPKEFEIGHDVIIETMTDEQIACLVGPATTKVGARRRVAKYMRLDPKFLQGLRVDFSEVGHATEWILRKANHGEAYSIWSYTEQGAIDYYLECDPRHVWHKDADTIEKADRVHLVKHVGDSDVAVIAENMTRSEALRAIQRENRRPNPREFDIVDPKSGRFLSYVLPND